MSGCCGNGLSRLCEPIRGIGLLEAVHERRQIVSGWREWPDSGKLPLIVGDPRNGRLPAYESCESNILTIK